jgi:hypothetical protein
LENPDMSALDTLRDAARHGVQITLDGDDLELAAPVAPPEAVLAAIKRHKAEIVTLLRAAMRPRGCSDDEWLAACIDAARLGYGLLITEQEKPS